MPNLPVPTVDALLTLGGLSVVVMGLLFTLRKAMALTDALMDRWGPLLAVTIGVIVALVATFALGLTGRVDLVQAIVTGLFAGWSSSGLYDTIRSQV